MRRSLRHAIPLVLLVAALLVVAGADAHSQAALDIRGNWWMVWGTVSGHTFTSHAKIGAYTSRGTATVVASGAKWRPRRASSRTRRARPAPSPPRG